MDEQKELEKLMDKLFEVDHLESPSADFTKSILEKIEIQEHTQLAYKPLLPKWVFIALGILVVIVVFLAFQNTDPGSSSIDYMRYFNASSTWMNNVFSGINLSKTIGYTILPLGLLICLQAKLLGRFSFNSHNMA